MSTIFSASQNVESPEELPVCTTVSCCDNTIQCNERFYFFLSHLVGLKDRPTGGRHAPRLESGGPCCSEASDSIIS